MQEKIIEWFKLNHGTSLTQFQALEVEEAFDHPNTKTRIYRATGVDLKKSELIKLDNYING